MHAVTLVAPILAAGRSRRPAALRRAALPEPMRRA
jgi:hypothetical protein